MRPNPGRCAAALAAVLLTLAVQQSSAAPSHRPLRHPRQHACRATPGTAGMTVAVDPLTGALRLPTVEEFLRLSPAEENSVSRSSAGLQQVRRPDGSVVMDLQGRFQDFMAVRIRPDGRKVFQCLEDRAALSPGPGTGARPADAPKMEER